jgi:flagellar basal-body rod protein FlgB
MPLNINQLFAPHEHVLKLANQRLELLAANIANADTPNYKARDIDFKAALQTAQGEAVTLQATQPGHIGGTQLASGRADVKYRWPDQPSLDGNTVDSQRESAAVAETSVRYQASLTFLNQQLRALRTAISGGR